MSRLQVNCRARAGLLAVALCVLATACGDITRVLDPTITTPADVQNPSGAASLRAGALNSLFSNFSAQSLFSGVFVDEFTVSSSGESSVYPEDQRNLSPVLAGNYPYGGLSNSRINAIIASATLKQYSPQPAWQIGELYALTAAVEIEFSEDMCSGVPLANVTGFTPSYGPTLSRQALLTRALTDLDSAAAYATQNDSIANLVAVLRGRVYADSGDLAGAASAVQAVPLQFAYAAELDDTTNMNQIYENTALYGYLTISDREGINGLPFVSAADPRLPILTLQAGGVAINASANIPSGSTPLIMASGVEAGLLTAEAELAAGQVNAWAATLNNLRQNAISPEMPSLTTDSTTTASPQMQLAVMFRERAFWLFGTGHRAGDLRRLVRQYGLSVNSVYPTGPYLGGPTTYGTSVVVPVGNEAVNPNFHGCLNSNP
jgi:hypothetical protein